MSNSEQAPTDEASTAVELLRNEVHAVWPMALGSRPMPSNVFTAALMLCHRVRGLMADAKFWRAGRLPLIDEVLSGRESSHAELHRVVSATMKLLRERWPTVNPPLTGNLQCDVESLIDTVNGLLRGARALKAHIDGEDASTHEPTIIEEEGRYVSAEQTPREVDRYNAVTQSFERVVLDGREVHVTRAGHRQQRESVDRMVGDPRRYGSVDDAAETVSELNVPHRDDGTYAAVMQDDVVAFGVASFAFRNGRMMPLPVAVYLEFADEAQACDVAKLLGLSVWPMKRFDVVKTALAPLDADMQDFVESVYCFAVEVSSDNGETWHVRELHLNYEKALESAQAHDDEDHEPRLKWLRREDVSFVEGRLVVKSRS